MLATPPAVRSTLVRAAALFLLVAVAVALSYSPVAAARPGPGIGTVPAPAPSASLVVTAVSGGHFIPSPIVDARVVVHDAHTGHKVDFQYTDSNGQVDFRLAPGDYVVAIEAAGRRAHTSEAFTLVANDAHSFMVVLYPAP